MTSLPMLLTHNDGSPPRENELLTLVTASSGSDTESDDSDLEFPPSKMHPSEEHGFSFRPIDTSVGFSGSSSHPLP
jgi:hypothetical protein